MQTLAEKLSINVRKHEMIKQLTTLSSFLEAEKNN